MRRAFIKGNDAVVCGALLAGCRAFFGYPITPASEIAHDAMEAIPGAGGIALQAESEVAAINMLYGAGAAGVAAMTATSGPGFGRMQEGISYMAAARVPGVIVDVMRSGPGLGNIGPEQGDVAMAIYGGHGDFRVPVFAPDSVREMFDMTSLAFDTAFRYRTPAIVLADAFVGQMMETLDLPDVLPAADAVPAVRYPLPYATDGTTATSGHIVSSLELVPARLSLKNDARFDDYARMTHELPMTEVDDPYGDAPQKIVLIAYGICARIAREAVDVARSLGIRVALFRPMTLWPFPASELLACATSSAKITVVELNRGMIQGEVERLTRRPVSGLHRDGGILPSADEILECVMREVQS